jgi:hypothetical protein
VLPTDGTDDPALPELRTFTTLQQLVRWAFARRTDVTEVIVQDEYSHDVVLPLGDRWLVADCT